MVVVGGGGGGGGGKFSDLKTSILYCENKTEVFTKKHCVVLIIFILQRL